MYLRMNCFILNFFLCAVQKADDKSGNSAKGKPREDETLCLTANLFRLDESSADSPEWDFAGNGTCRFLRNETKKTDRIVMLSAEPEERTMLNHYVIANMELVASEGKKNE